MKTSNAFPPNYASILEAFPTLERYRPIFTYGDTIYNPWNITIPPDLMVHEETHSERQSNPVLWWIEYLQSPDFRLKEEILAYQAQWQYALANYSRPERRRLLDHITSALSSSLYGSIITKQEAKERITHA